MSRIKSALIVAGVTVAAGAVGGALGVLFAPASGTETRRRLAWRTEEPWRSVARASERLLARADAFPREEQEERNTRKRRPVTLTFSPSMTFPG